jgi:beta-lactamase class A
MEGILHAFKPGLAMTPAELLESMVTESDNTATDLLFRLVGGPAVVMGRLRELELSGIDVSRTELRIAADVTGVKRLPADERISPERLRQLQRRVTKAARKDAERRFGSDPRDTASPEAMGNLLVRLYRGELLGRPSTDRLLGLMRRCRTGDSRLRALLPAGTEVFDKTGTGGGSANDVGIVTLPNQRGHLMISVFIKESTASMAARERSIAEIGRAAYEYFGARGAEEAH